MITDLYTPTVKRDDSEKEPLQLFPQELFSAFIFLITLTLLGLECPVAYLLLPVVLFSTFLRNRYDFLIQFTILCGSYGFFDESETFPFKWMDIALLLSIITIVIYRRDKTLWTENAAGAEAKYYQAETETDEALYVARTISDLMNAQGYAFSDFAGFSFRSLPASSFFSVSSVLSPLR